MKRINAAVAIVSVSALVLGAAGRSLAGSEPIKSILYGPVLPQAHGVLEIIPQSGLFLGLRMLNGKMYAVNGGGGKDADVTPRIIMGPQQASPPIMRILPSPPTMRYLPLSVLPKAPPPHRR